MSDNDMKIMFLVFIFIILIAEIIFRRGNR